MGIAKVGISVRLMDLTDKARALMELAEKSLSSAMRKQLIDAWSEIRMELRKEQREILKLYCAAEERALVQVNRVSLGEDDDPIQIAAAMAALTDEQLDQYLAAVGEVGAEHGDSDTGEEARGAAGQ